MKRLLFIASVVLCTIVVGCTDNVLHNKEAQDRVIVALSAEEQLEEKLAWDYPVRYGAPGWDALKTVEEKFNAYNIPDAIMNSISTEELVKICMNYPQWGLMHAYNDRRSGLSVLISLFNGFQELFKREDSAVELLKMYEQLDPLAVDPTWIPLQQGTYSAKFEKIEMFLSARSMIEKLNKEEIQHLKEVAISKYQKKKELPGIYSLWDLSPTVAICVKIIEKENSELLNANRDEINFFIFSMMSENIQFLDGVVELLKTSAL